MASLRLATQRFLASMAVGCDVRFRVQVQVVPNLSRIRWHFESSTKVSLVSDDRSVTLGSHFALLCYMELHKGL